MACLKNIHSLVWKMSNCMSNVKPTQDTGGNGRWQAIFMTVVVDASNHIQERKSAKSS